MTPPSHPIDEVQVDRARELASIGAGHAANALAAMLGRPCTMRVPTVRLLSADRVQAPYVAGDTAGHDRMGVFFELDGGPGGVVALLFPGEVRDRLIDSLLGDRGSDPEIAESALRELGNILVSHVASSIADTIGDSVVPSIPVLAMKDAGSALASLLAPRATQGGALRIETEIADERREIRGLLVFMPDDVEAPTDPHPA
ncbi:MAG: hypothetical protein CL910_02130 [Deltaproteobacteria bacterium]|jgi:chemotaxis protein CheC|nr:hypothetical protein [Deltaproteobacteria bacterium]